MKTATQGTLAFGGLDWKITGDPSKKELRGTAAGSVAHLKIVNRRVLSGTLDGEKVEMRAPCCGRFLRPRWPNRILGRQGR